MSAIRLDTTGHVALVVLSRPPHNFFDEEILSELADVIDHVDARPHLRATVLASDQRSFCAGADFGGSAKPNPALIYAQAVRLAGRRKPMIAAVNGAAVGGGMGLALMADFRVGDSGARFQANFLRIGISAGFGLSLTLPRLIGDRAARDLFLTGRSIGADEAFALGLLDRLEAPQGLRDGALRLAGELATNAPAAMIAMRDLLAPGAQMLFQAAVERELALQAPLFASADFKEGVEAARDRRIPIFKDIQEYD